MSVLRERFEAEERLVEDGASERVARRLGGWSARLGDPLAAAERIDAGTFDEARAIAELLRARAQKRPTLEVLRAIVAVHEWLATSERAAPSRDALAVLSGVPEARRGEIERTLASEGVQIVAAIASGRGAGAASAMAVLVEIAADPRRPASAAAASAHRAIRRDAEARMDLAIAELEAIGPEASIEARSTAVRAACAIDTDLGGDRELRRRLLRAWLAVAWRAYTDRKWDDLRALIAAASDVIEALAREHEARPDELAYRASIAQAIVFRSEVAETLDAQIAIAERALALCPTLRNARVVLAAHLLARARRTAGEAGRRDAERALELDPSSSEAKKRVARAG